MTGAASKADWLLLLGISLIWGSSFILIDRSLQAFAPVEVACLRLVLTAAVLFPFFIKYYRTLNLRQARHITVQSLFGNFIPAFLFPAAQVHVNSATAGILNALSPAWAFLLGLLFFGTAFRWQQLAGIVVAFAGAVLLLLPGNSGAQHYGWLLVVGTLCYGLSSNLVHRHLQGTHALAISSAGFIILSVPALIILMGSMELREAFSQPEVWPAFSSIVVLSVMGSAVASTLFYRLVQRTNTLFATSVTYLMPVVAVGWGLLGGEHLHLSDFAGMLLILAGIYLLSRLPAAQSC